MTIRSYKFLIVITSLLASLTIQAQQVVPGDSLAFRKAAARALLQRSGTPESALLQTGWTSSSFYSNVDAANTGQAIVSQDHYVKNLSFFCRQELRFQKTVKVPLRLRMGSLEECNRLEGK